MAMTHESFVQVTEEEFAKDVDRYLGEAERQPVFIKGREGVSTVMITLEEYFRLLGMERDAYSRAIRRIEELISALQLAQASTSGTVTVEIMVSENLLQEARDVGVDIQAAAAAGIEAAVERARAERSAA